MGDPKNTRRLASRDTLVIRHRPFRLRKQKLPNAPVVVRRQRDTRAVHPLQERSGNSASRAPCLRPRPMDFATHHHGHRNHLHPFSSYGKWTQWTICGSG
ncbi:polyhydroxybutyrate depolymerase [Bifidobacterium adolescentis]|nr:polyhydroxybutyrate depolymerase [Bifidobacterium adolescentis]